MTAPSTTGPGKVAPLTADEVPAAALTIARAFHDLAPSRFLLPDEEVRARLYPFTFRCDVADVLGHGIVRALPQAAGVALWLEVPDGGLPAPELDSRIVDLAGRELAEHYLSFYSALHAAHPAEEHLYLEILAVDPGLQRRGLGSLLLRDQIEKRGRDRAVYLEAAEDGLRGFYARAGFEDHSDPIVLPDGVTRMYPMMRPAR